MHSQNFTPQQALPKIKQYCAYQERCHSEIKEKLYGYGLSLNDAEEIISKLVEENFLNEERFAIHFAGGKFRIKHWGKVKITQALKLHKISPYCIKKALLQIPDDDYEKSLKKVLEKKRAAVTGKLTPLKARKIALFAQTKGYESNLIWKFLKMDNFEE